MYVYNTILCNSVQWCIVGLLYRVKVEIVCGVNCYDYLYDWLRLMFWNICITCTLLLLYLLRIEYAFVVMNAFDVILIKNWSRISEEFFVGINFFFFVIWAYNQLRTTKKTNSSIGWIFWKQLIRTLIEVIWKIIPCIFLRSYYFIFMLLNMNRRHN